MKVRDSLFGGYHRMTNIIVVAKDIRVYAGHKIPTIEHLEVARDIIEKVQAYNGGDAEELPSGTYIVVSWGA
jgi:hypothetical protein